jgi:DNA-binding winged helix-turn-helix (wHTH) protein/tetratricopeptide (TPR) repeat protein
MSSEVFVFDGCELQAASRTLLVDGVERALEPRPFDVLVHLVMQRHRCVARDELLREFWRGESASASGLTRAIMKIRQVVDRGAAGSLVRTVQRAGYQFVGQVDVALRPMAVAEPSRDSVAFLPFDNCTGLPDLDWVELGLASLVARELPRHAPVQVPALAAVLLALQSASARDDVDARAALVRRLLGVDRVVFASLHVEGPRFRLRCTVFPSAAQSADVSSDDPAALAVLLARRLGECWYPGRPPAMAPAVTDGLAGGRLLAGALQAVASQQWSRALALLDELLLADPRHAVARRERMRTLVALDDNRAFELGELLLREAAQVGDPAAQAAIHLELANAYVRRRLASRASGHLDSALAHAPADVVPADLLATTILRASLAMTEFDFAQSARLLERADKQCALHGNVLDRIRLTSLRVVHEAETGDMAAAHAHALTCASMYRDHGVLAGHARALASLANASASLGRFDEAVRHAEAALALSRSLAIPTDTAVTVATLCGLYRHLRRPADLERALAALRDVDTAASPRNDIFHLVSHAHHEIVHGRHSRAVRLLAQAREEVLAAGQHLELHFVLPLLAGSLVATGRLIEAGQTCEEIARLPRFHRDRNLQGALLHCRAQLAHALGDGDQALARLFDAIAATRPGWWHAQARLDAAWLLIEGRRPDEASVTVAPIVPWLREHPVGRLIVAQLEHAAGRFEDSRVAQAQLVVAATGTLRAYAEDVAEARGADRGESAGAALPRAGCLATCL